MKNLLIVLSLFASLRAFAGEEIQVGVKGMVCAFCAQGIEKKFKAEPSVEKVKVSLENKLVKLNLKDGQKLSKDRITEILKDSGYEAVFDGSKK
jgi:copper chaperone CopZ